MKSFTVFLKYPTLCCYSTLWIFSLLIHSVDTQLEIGGIIIAGTTAFFYQFYSYSICKIYKCCEEKRSVPDLKASLEARIYGQHLVVNSVASSIKGHLHHDPRKALVLSFQGWTGTGKNLVAQIIAENMYAEGLKSSFVHVLTAGKHFSRPERVADYKDELKDWLIGNISACPYQLFIFDEVEKMPSGVLDVLKPFVDFVEVTNDKVDYRKAIYILLGNAGGRILFDKTYQHYNDGKIREQLELKDFESKLWTEAFNEKGGLEHSSLINADLIDAYVPFLPLERRHVKLCVENDIESKNFTLFTRGLEEYRYVVDKVMEQLSFTPANVEVYSSSGCKRVFQKVNLILEEIYD